MTSRGTSTPSHLRHLRHAPHTKTPARYGTVDLRAIGTHPAPRRTGSWDTRSLRGRAFVLVTVALSVAGITACQTDSADTPVTTTTLDTGSQPPDTGAEQRCTVIFQTPTSGQTSARRTVVRLDGGEEVAEYEAGEHMPPVNEIPGCEPE